MYKNINCLIYKYVVKNVIYRYISKVYLYNIQRGYNYYSYPKLPKIYISKS